MPIADVPVVTTDDVSHWLTTFNSFASNVNSAFASHANVSGSFYLGASARLSSTLKVTGSATLSNTLTVTDNFTASANTIIAGSATISAASFTGSATISGTMSINSRMRMSNTLLTVSGQMTSITPVYLLDASNNNVGLTLCAASVTVGTILWVKRKDVSENDVIIGVSGGADLIQGSAALGVDSRAGVILYSDGSGWHDFVS